MKAQRFRKIKAARKNPAFLDSVLCVNHKSIKGAMSGYDVRPLAVMKLKELIVLGGRQKKSASYPPVSFYRLISDASVWRDSSIFTLSEWSCFFVVLK